MCARGIQPRRCASKEGAETLEEGTMVSAETKLIYDMFIRLLVSIAALPEHDNTLVWLFVDRVKQQLTERPNG